MTSLRALMLLAVVCLFASGDPASAEKQTTKNHTFRGTVVHVHHDKGKKHHGTITVKHHLGKGNSVTKTFRINESTNIHSGDPSKGTSSKLHKGLHVAVVHTGHHAEDIKLGHDKKK